jgi:membrane-bound serine protease (ClpP class)
MVIGSLMLIDTPIPELKPSLKFIIPVAVGLSLIFIFLVTLAIRAHSRKVHTGQEGLVGEIGTAQTQLNPEGKIFVHGEIWNAIATEDIEKGAKVKVIEVLNHLTIKVTKA